MADPDVCADRGAVQPDVVDLHLHTGETEAGLFHVDQDGGRYGCIFRKNCASVPEERSAIPLQTEQSSAG